MIIPIGLVYAAVYYVVFRFLIRRFDLMTPGREPDEDADDAPPIVPEGRTGGVRTETRT
jgi:phosphotransferase system  glucose/maltose/N-acetylglucosamine-specific IIC component